MPTRTSGFFHGESGGSCFRGNSAGFGMVWVESVQVKLDENKRNEFWSPNGGGLVATVLRTRGLSARPKRLPPATGTP